MKRHIRNKYCPLKRLIIGILNNVPKDDVCVTWFGHSTVLMQIAGMNIMTDPILNGGRVPPLKLGPKPFPYSNRYDVKDLPDIDAVLISHDHYDHLDMETVKKLKGAKFYVPLGVKSHLLKWGLKESDVLEHDWYDSSKVADNMELLYVPTRHFSGRGLFNRNSTLWGGWIINAAGRKILFGGDSGYFDVYKDIGKRYGPFDLAMLDNGQYNELWQNVHMMPEETVQASIDLKAGVLLPIHWGKYTLSLHSWYEPIERISVEADKKNMNLATPMIGESFLLGKNIPNNKWWKNHSEPS